MGCITSGPAFQSRQFQPRIDHLDASTHVFDQKDRLPADLVAEIFDEQLAPIYDPRIHQFSLITKSIFVVFESYFLTRGVKLEGVQGYALQD